MGEKVMDMRVDFPGLLIERHRNGTQRIRVRVEGNADQRIHIPVTPDHPDFAHHYHAARAGQHWQPPKTKGIEHSLDWLTARYLKFLADMASSGQMSPLTLKQRKSILTRLCDFTDDDGTRYGDCDMNAPASAFVQIRDSWAGHPGAADNLIKSTRALYQWAMDRGEIDANPAAGIGKINRNPKGGAVPWSADDMRKFKDTHPPGTTAHFWLTLEAFTAGRIGDLVWLGRDQETTRHGHLWLEWQPRKKGSAFVSIPMLPPLIEATRAARVIGPTYLLTDQGKPFATPEALRNRVQKWCASAGLVNRSSHGVRKAVGDMLAEAGCTQHQIMAVMAHTQARTSEIYTKDVSRQNLAAAAMTLMSGFKW